MKLLIDMNLIPIWVDFFSEHSIEAVHSSKVGNPSAPDRVILEYAAHSEFVVFTHDLDFGTLLAQSHASTPSVLQVRAQDVLPSSIGQAVLSALSLTRTQLSEGALVTVDPTTHRVRILPIR